MAELFDTVLRLRAWEAGRAVRGVATTQVMIQPDARVLTALALAGEDATIHIVAVGRIGQRARILCVPDPRVRDDQYKLFEALANEFEPYFQTCLFAGSAPQLWVSSSAAATHLDVLADRLRYNRQNARVARLGELLSYPAHRYPIAGQQALYTATSAMRHHWFTGQQEGEDEHLGALLAWIEPPPGMPAIDAARLAELNPAGVKTDPDFDRQILEPLVAAYNRARRAKAALSELRLRAERITDALRPIVLDIYMKIQRAIALVQGLGLAQRADLPLWERQEAEEFRRFMDSRANGYPLTLRDTPVAAAHEFVTREEALQRHETAVLYYDAAGRARGRLSGDITAGVARNPRQTRLGPRKFEYRFELESTQAVLRLRPRDELYLITDPRFKVEVVSVSRSVGVARIDLRIKSGQRAIGLPASGQTMELAAGRLDWDSGGRQHGKMKERLDDRPWTHTPGATPPAATPALVACPADPLADVEALR